MLPVYPTPFCNYIMTWYGNACYCIDGKRLNGKMIYLRFGIKVQLFYSINFLRVIELHKKKHSCIVFKERLDKSVNDLINTQQFCR